MDNQLSGSDMAQRVWLSKVQVAQVLADVKLGPMQVHAIKRQTQHPLGDRLWLVSSAVRFGARERRHEFT